MITKYDAIHSLFEEFHSGKGRSCEGSLELFDNWSLENGGKTGFNETDVNTRFNELTTEYDANQYQRDRQYPQLGEQLDMLFHDMTAGKGSKSGEWYKAIAKVKADNPKG